ncbi:MAG TPA: hypothetical protein VFG89_05680 [Coriobacteriia bacterium]|nr:hypothetical protein [Coriobacteriia bacterium]
MSDQDFFFDEDEQPKDVEPVKVSAPKPAKAKAAAAAAPAAQGVSVAIASLIGVIALLAGLIVGILLPIGGTPATSATNTPSSPAGQTAPQLSNEQMQSGQLPSGHPDISGMSGSTGTSGTSGSTGTGK